MRTSLQVALIWAAAPFCLVGAVGVLFVNVDARNVHRDVQRMFEEQREVSLTRTLLDELRGIEQWTQLPTLTTAEARSLARADMQQHLRSARATAARFQHADDPSQPDHEAEEAGTLRQLDANLGRIDTLLAGQAPLSEVREPIALALRGASALDAKVSDESREIGAGLDQRTERLVDLLGLLAVAGLSTLLWLAFWMRRRILLPIRQLHAGTTELASGRAIATLRVPGHDELARLAGAFTHMAEQVRLAKSDLEARVEARSREVLRTARLAELGTLSAGIAHEVNNPLASIATCAEGLLRDLDRGHEPDLQHQRDYLQIIRKEAMRTRDITTRLLSFARNDQGCRVDVDLAAELREVAALFQHQFASAQVALVLPRSGAHAVIAGDPAEWRQVLFNLLRNALDASPRGATVEATVSTQGERVVLAVADRGPGFAAAIRDRVFEPFLTTKPPGKGTGLGLAIVHRIVTGHGGTVSALDRDGGGAVIRIEMPARAATAVV